MEKLLNANEEEVEKMLRVAEINIMEMLQQMHAMGGNDREHSQVQDILDRLKKGMLEPAEAVFETEAILKRKIEGAYH